MSRQSGSKTSPLEALTALLVIATGLAWALYVNSHSWFHSDDLKNFALAFDSTLLAYVLTPIDVHFVPLHRLVNYLILYAAPMNFPVALGALLLVHLASVYYFYRLLQGLAPGRQNHIFVLLYALNATFYAILVWWSAGLHRFPYLFLTLSCMVYFLEFLNGGRRKKLMLSVALFVLALGFYSKAVLIPGYLICLCLARQVIAPGERFREGLVAGGTLLAFSCLYTFWFLLSQDTGDAKVSLNLSAVWHSWWLGMKYSSQTLMPWIVLFLRPELVAAFWVLALVATIWRGPRVAILWFLGLGCVAVNVLVIAASSRSDAVVAITAVTARYSFEVVFLQLWFLALIVHCCAGSMQWSAGRPVRWLVGLFLALFLSGYAVLSADKAVRIVSADAERQLQASIYAKNFQRDLDALGPLEELNFEDRPVPVFLTGGIMPNHMPLSTFIALHQRGTPQYDAPGRPLYRVNRQGKIRPVRK